MDPNTRLIGAFFGAHAELMMEIDYHYDYEYHDVFTSGLINIYPDFLMIIRMVLPLNGEDKIIQVNVAFFRVHPPNTPLS